MNDEPTVQIHGETIDQHFLLMVESHVINGVQFSHDGYVLADSRARANPGALELFDDAPYTVALCLEWLREHAVARGLAPHLFTH